MKYAGKSDLVLEPRASVDLGATGVSYSTQKDWRKTLGGLDQLGVKGELVYKFSRANGAATATVTLSLKTASGQVVGSESIDLAQSAVTNGKMLVDLGAVSGGSPLYCEVDVTTADAGTTAELDAVLTVETPVIVGGC